MAACGHHSATARFEHIISDISRTARDSSLKFGIHIHLNSQQLHVYPNKKSIDMMSSGVRGQKTCILPIFRKVLGLESRDRKSTRLNSSHVKRTRMPSSA